MASGTKKKQDGGPGQAKWMISFADLLSLILTFFVLIYSMAQPMQFTNIYERQYNSVVNLNPEVNFSQVKAERILNRVSSEYLMTLFEGKLSEGGAYDELSFSTKEDLFVISLDKDRVNPQVAAAVADILKNFGNQKKIVGPSLDDSYNIAQILDEKGVTEFVGFHQHDRLKDKIDIIIFP